MLFYLGTDRPHWLADSEVPLFVSHRVLRDRRRLPRAPVRWALDSGAFSELSLYGRFETTPAAYVAAIRRYRDRIGNLDWAAPQDHMCEPWVLAKSELASTVAEAQAWTVRNLLELRERGPELPIIPVLQGQTMASYHEHREAYERAGVDLAAEPLVGLGSVCRRQATAEIASLIGSFTDLALHGFGVKAYGLARYGSFLSSADSMAWSYWGRRTRPCPVRGTGSCSHCRHFALAWRTRLLRERPPSAI
ncbi:MAG TPA: hypothetical protein VIX41_11200, partial [Acidimicrobiales bacterium]